MKVFERYRYNGLRKGKQRKTRREVSSLRKRFERGPKEKVSRSENVIHRRISVLMIDPYVIIGKGGVK